jgi:hypothetical protein
MINALLGVGRLIQETHCTAGLSCDRMLMECTHDGYDCVLLNLGVSNNRHGTDARKYPLRFRHLCYPEANVFRGLEKRLLETETVTFNTLVNASRPSAEGTPIKKYAVIAAVER